MRDTVVLHPGLGVGHLVPTLELARLFLRRGLAVTVLLVEPPGTPPSTARAAAANNPSIHFHTLPLPAAPDAAAAAAEERNPFAVLRRANAPLRDYLHSALSSVRALVLDMFCVDALDVAAGLGVPAYLFYTSGAGSLAVSLHLPHAQAALGATTSFGDIIGDDDAPLLRFPGAPPFKPTELPENALDCDNAVYREFLRAFERFPESRGILVNTFEWLEATAVAALRDGACVPGRPMPPVYSVGPLVVSGDGGEVNSGNKRHPCLEWLDAQPENSVVFLCFGSMGSFPKRQLEAIANGLEKSGQRFLWVVRNPRRGDAASLVANDQLPEPDLDELLPEGFVERTGGRGLVVKSWAPQAEVLRHGATGAFVTHCGWNSTLEGITSGVPLLCWPLYAEQRVNKVFIVEAARVGVEMEGYDGEVVAAEEVESKIRWVMDSEEGRELRGRAALAKEKALEALEQGGTSHKGMYSPSVQGVDLSPILQKNPPRSPPTTRASSRETTGKSRSPRPNRRESPPLYGSSSPIAAAAGSHAKRARAGEICPPNPGSSNLLTPAAPPPPSSPVAQRCPRVGQRGGRPGGHDGERNGFGTARG